MIRLEGISRTFEVGGEPVHALVDVTEQIAAGEHIAIMGPSGSGKSTLLHIIGCLDRPDGGTYELMGRDVGGLDEAALSLVRRHTIGFVFQFFHLVPRLTALENVELPMLFAGIEPPERRERAMGRLRAVGLEPRASHRPDQLSGGERQRVALARATVLDPKVVLADEPTGNLDTASGRQVLGLLEEMNASGLTLIVVTHDPAVARRARRVVVLMDGRVVSRVEGSRIHEALEALTGGGNGR
ncbi:MAG: macrolide ABC transporter ATP-binding protein [Acidobacteria bacterium RBG_16_70_10]|nr:MAG: macrolide ABC transporter ATP-binding protein [Acidobacteria bacterium RBG_16_70_10]